VSSVIDVTGTHRPKVSRTDTIDLSFENTDMEQGTEMPSYEIEKWNEERLFMGLGVGKCGNSKSMIIYPQSQDQQHTIN